MEFTAFWAIITILIIALLLGGGIAAAVLLAPKNKNRGPTLGFTSGR